MPKGSKMMPKWNLKSLIFLAFSTKGENARNHCIYKLKRGSGHVENDEISMKNRCKNKVRKRYANLKQK